MAIIKDGTGTGNTLRVNTENRAEVSSVSQPLDAHINQKEHKVWSMPFEGIDPVGADDYFVYIENSGTKDLRITDIRVQSTVAGTIELHHVTGTPSYTADTDIGPVNRYLGSSNVPDAIAKTDTNTTGLVDQGVIFYVRCDTANKTFHLSTSSNILIPPGQKIGFLWDTATGILSGVISLVEAE